MNPSIDQSLSDDEAKKLLELAKENEFEYGFIKSIPSYSTHILIADLELDLRIWNDGYLGIHENCKPLYLEKRDWAKQLYDLIQHREEEKKELSLQSLIARTQLSVAKVREALKGEAR